MFSHRFHGSTQIVWVRKILPQIAQNSQNLLLGDVLPQISQIYTDGLSAKDPPTDCTEFTEPSAGDNLPQISRIYTDGLSAEDSPTDCTEFTEPANFRRVCQNSVNAG